MAIINAGQVTYEVTPETDGTLRINVKDVNGCGYIGLVGWVGVDHVTLAAGVEKVYDHASGFQLANLTRLRQTFDNHVSTAEQDAARNDAISDARWEHDRQVDREMRQAKLDAANY